MNKLNEIKKEITKPDYYDNISVIDYSYYLNDIEWWLKVKIFHLKKLKLYDILKFFKELGGIKVLEWDEDVNYDFDINVATYFVLELDKEKYKKYQKDIKTFIKEILLIKNIEKDQEN